MTSVRTDLLALGEAEIVALANRGLYKRAQKMMAKNEHQVSLQDDGTVFLKLGKVETKLEAGRSLARTSCSCGAQNLCRHKILAILAYQESASTSDSIDDDGEWSPGNFSDEEVQELVGRSAWRRATRLKTSGSRIKLVRGDKPAAHLPTCSVSFLVPRDLSYVRCDCSQEGPCEHMALAVWAFRLNGDSVSFDVKESKLELEFTSTDRVLEELLHLGVAAVEPGTVKLLRDQAKIYQKQKLVWLSDLSSDMADSVESYLARGAGFQSGRHCALLVEWWARTIASRTGPSSDLLGYGEAQETSLEQTSLTCLGVRLSQDEAKSFAELFFAEPHTGVVTVLSRTWKGTFSGPEIGRKRAIPESNLGKLATSQMITESAKRRANRTLIIGRSRVGKTSVFEDQGDWSTRFSEPLLVNDFEILRSEFQARRPAILSARLRAENLRVLTIKGVEDLVYAPGSQTLYAKLLDLKGSYLNMVCYYRPAEPGALSCFAETLRAGPRHLSGFVSLRSGEVEFEPLSVVCDRVYCPALAEPKEFSDVPYIATVSRHDPLAQIWDLCERTCYQGFKFLSPQWREECREIAKRLRIHGYPILAERLVTLAQEPTRQNWFAVALRAFLLNA